MKRTLDRTIFRWIHIIFGLMILGYIYGPPDEVLPYRDNFRFIFVPVILISGLWMWKGAWLRQRLTSKAV